MTRSRVLTGWTALLLAACAREPRAGAALPDAPLEARELQVHAQPDLTEGSAAVASTAQPGVIFTINDSGHPAELFALDTTGRDRGTWRVLDATNRDWEALAPVPCASADSAAAPPRCLIIADTGDNDEWRDHVTLYRVPEPAALAPGGRDAVRAERLELTYEGGARDVEAVYAGPQGNLFLITKRRQRAPDGATRPAMVLEVDAAAWAAGRTTARIVDSLPLLPGSARGRLITDAARSPDGARVAVRTYFEVYVFAADSATGAIRTAVPPARCDISGIAHGSGEGITWLADGRLLLTEEGRDAPLQVVRCPQP